MKNNKTLIILILVFVLLIGGASVLYSQLGDSFSPNQLSVQDTTTDAYPTNEATGDSSTNEETTADANNGKSLAPDFTVYDADGNKVSLSDFRGKPVVLNFWASWCGPCRSEMPDFNEKYKELGDEVYFLMVNATGGRETVETAKDFIGETDYVFPVYFDADGIASAAYSVYSLPTTYLIDAEGYIIAQATGAIDATTLQRGIDMIR